MKCRPGVSFILAAVFTVFAVMPVYATVNCRDALLEQASQIKFNNLTPELWQLIREKLHCIETSNQYFAAGDSHGSSGNSTGDFGTSKIAITDIGRVYLKGWDKKCNLINTVRTDDELYEYFSMAYADIVLGKLAKCTRKVKNGKTFVELSPAEQAEEVAVYGWYLPGKYCSGTYNKSQQANIKGRESRLKECEKPLPEPDYSTLKFLTETDGVASVKFSEFEDYLSIVRSDSIVDATDHMLLSIKIHLFMDERVYSRSASRRLYGDWEIINMNRPKPLLEYDSPYFYDGDMLVATSDDTYGPPLSGLIRLPGGLRIMPFDLQRVLSAAAASAEERKTIKKYVEIASIRDVDYRADPFDKQVFADGDWRQFHVNPFNDVVRPVPGKYLKDFWAKRLWKTNPYYRSEGVHSSSSVIVTGANNSYSNGCNCDKTQSASSVKMTAPAVFTPAAAGAYPAVPLTADALSARISSFLTSRKSVAEILSGRQVLQDALGVVDGEVYMQASDLDADNEPEVILSRLDGAHGNINAVLDLRAGKWSVVLFDNPAMYLQRVIVADVTGDGRPEMICENSDGAVSSRSVSVYSYKDARVVCIGDFASYEEGSIAVKGSGNNREIVVVSYPKYDGPFLDSPYVRARRLQQYRWNGKEFYLYRESYPRDYSLNVLSEFLDACKSRNYPKLYELLHSKTTTELQAAADKQGGGIGPVDVLKSYMSAEYPELVSFEEGELIPVDGGMVHDILGLGQQVDGDILEGLRNSRYFGELRFRKLYDGKDLSFRLVLLWENNEWRIVKLERCSTQEQEALPVETGEFVFDNGWSWDTSGP